LKRAVALVLLLAPLAASAQRPRDLGADAIDFSAEREVREGEVKLPPRPRPENLIKFDPGRPTSMSFYVDATSLVVGDDGIIRFTSVAKGDGSTENVVYEGIRCTTRERKVYAYGKADGTWSETRDAAWSPIRNINVDGYRFTLYQEYFCAARGSIRSAAEGVAALKSGGHPQATDFMRNAPVPR
jgi:hypothetical protein